MRVTLTQYGYASDPDGDTLTREGWGAWDNKLTAASCALKRSTATLIGASPRCKIMIVLPSGNDMYRFWDDVIPPQDIGDRCDLYQPLGFDKTLPDTANIFVVADTGTTPAQSGA
jgi:hypothetical protein